MYVAIYDDDPVARALAERYLRRYAAQCALEADGEAFSDGAALLARFARTHRAFDAVLMDVYLNRENGVEVARQLLTQGFDGCLVFTTSSRDFAADAFELQAEDYLVKPIAYERFARAMDRVCQKRAALHKTISFPAERTEITLALGELCYIESAPHGCVVHARGEALFTRTALARFEESLGEESGFFRLRKSHIVNLNYMERFDDEYLYLTDGARLPLPVRDKAKVRRLLADFYWKQT